MLTQKDYCDYDTCVALNELGFPIEWFEDETWHENNTNILLYEAQKWLREEKNMDVNAFYDNMDAVWRFYIVEIDYPDLSGTHAYKDAFMSYEEALLEGIKEAIKLLKEERK